VTDDAKTGLRALGFSITQLGLVAAMVYAIVDVHGWVGPTWMITIVLLFFVRLDKWGARRDLAKLRGTDEDEDEEEFNEASFQEIQEKVAKATMRMSILSAPIIESADGQRAKLVADGWSETAAEQMAVSYYSAMIGSFHREQGRG
jgi:hypothetical protein